MVLSPDPEMVRCSSGSNGPYTPVTSRELQEHGQAQLAAVATVLLQPQGIGPG